MTIYWQGDGITLHHGNCVSIMADMPEASVDAIVCDPPYGLEFMGKDWDKFGVGKQPKIGEPDGSKFRQNMGTPSFTDNGNPTCKNCGGDKYRNGPRKCSCTAPNFGNPQAESMRGFQRWSEQWAREALRVLKPGGHLLAFGGTRTWHRLAVAVEDAGFEIRDSIAWHHQRHVFCQCSPVPYNHATVSREGVPGLRKDLATDDALSSSSEPDVLKGVREHAYGDSELGGQAAATEARRSGVRELREAFPDSPESASPSGEPDLLASVQRSVARTGVGEARIEGPRCLDGRESGVLQAEDVRREQSGVAGGRHLLAQEGELPTDQVRPGPGVGAADVPEGRVHHGTSTDHGPLDRTPSEPTGGCAPSRPQPPEQQPGEPGALAVEWIPQGGGAWPGCPRCRKPLAPPFDGGHLTWNFGSGFPKSLDVSKAIDKAAGAEREVTGSNPNHRAVSGVGYEGIYAGGNTGGAIVTAPATDAARKWQGWGTALKPAHEPIVVARKPLEGTVAANVLAHGTGALNIDGCRIGDDTSRGDRYNGKPPGGSHSMQIAGARDKNWSVPPGRWPANVVLDEDQAAALDEQSGEASYNPAGVFGVSKRNTEKGQGIYGNGDGIPTKGIGVFGYGDKGGASRFFYVTREEPCKVHEVKRCTICLVPAPDVDNIDARFKYCAKAPKNERPTVDGVNHPTVKPLTLMRYLVRLVTPPGGTVLDPFAGSGTTIEAAILEGFTPIGIEQDAAYLPLIQERIRRCQERPDDPGEPTLFEEPA